MADHPEDLAGRRLLVQRLGQVLVTRLQFLEQPHILDGDDCLIGEGFEQGHLGIGEGTHLRAQDRDRAEGLSLAQQRNLRHAVDGVELQQLERVGILPFRDEVNIVDDDSPPIQNRAPPGETAGQGKRQAHQPLHLVAGVRGVVEAVALEALDHRIARCTETHGALRDSLQHRLELGRRPGDDPKNVRGRRLAVERGCQIAVARLQLLEQADVLDGDHRLVGEGFEECDLPLRERSRRVSTHRERADRLSITQQRHG